VHKKIEERYAKAEDVVSFHVQTVFEGEHTNTPAHGLKEAKSHGIAVPVGFDGHVDGARLSDMLQRYGAGGTPWTIVIDKKGIVRFNDFTPDEPSKLNALIDKLRADK